ncbi:MAG: hypothetical protein V1715_02675 [bacterium]
MSRIRRRIRLSLRNWIWMKSGKPGIIGNFIGIVALKQTMI